MMAGAVDRKAGGAARPLLQVRRLTASYGLADVLFGLDLELAEGEVVALVGRNGAGKTTTLKAIMGLITRNASELTFAGHDLSRLAPYQIARLGLGYVPEERRIFTDLTVLENLEVGRRDAPPGREPWTLDRLFRLFPNLADMRGRSAAAMSGGEQQMLSIARTLMGNPSAVLLDEPSEGLAPIIVEEMAKAVIAMKREGIAVLLSEQNLHFAGAVSDRACVIERGLMRFTGTIGELEANPQVREAHLAV